MEEEVIEEEVVEETKPDPQIEERARLQGWTPKEEFRGDPDRWITAEQFVERADTMMPIMKAQNKKYESRLIALEKELKDQKELTTKMIKIHGKYSQESYDSKRAELKIQKAKAVEDGDVELYKKLEDQEEKIPAPEIINIEEEEAPAEHEDITRWKKENSNWYGKDAELTEYADIIAAKIGAKGHSYTHYEFCEAVKKKVRTMFPDKFENPNKKKGSGVDEPGTRGSEPTGGKKKGWADLPKEAKAQCKEFVDSIPGFTKERYIKDYFEGE